MKLQVYFVVVGVFVGVNIAKPSVWPVAVANCCNRESGGGLV